MIGAFRLFPQKCLAKLRRGIVNAKIVARAVERPIRRFPNTEHSVEPGEIAVGAAAPELTREFKFLHLGPELHCLFADGGDRSDILHVYALLVVYEEDRNQAGLHQLPDLIFPSVPEYATLFTQPVGFVHKNAGV